MDRTTNPRAFLTRVEVERRLNISTSTLRRMVEAGTISAYKFGRDLRFDPADIDGYIAASRIPRQRTAS